MATVYRKIGGIDLFWAVEEHVNNGVVYYKVLDSEDLVCEVLAQNDIREFEKKAVGHIEWLPHYRLIRYDDFCIMYPSKYSGQVILQTRYKNINLCHIRSPLYVRASVCGELVSITIAEKDGDKKKVHMIEADAYEVKDSTCWRLNLNDDSM